MRCSDAAGWTSGYSLSRSHLRPEKELSKPEKNSSRPFRRLANDGLVAADVFLQVHENFHDYAVNHPEKARRKYAREQFSRTLDYAAAAGSDHVTILPGVTFKAGPRSDSLARAAEALLVVACRAGGGDEFNRGRRAVHVGSITDTPARALQLAAAVPGLGLTLDYAHFTRAGIPDARIGQPLAARATHLHARCARKGRLQCGLRKNTIDFGRALAALRGTSITGHGLDGAGIRMDRLGTLQRSGRDI